MKIFSLVSIVFFALMPCSAQAIAAETPPKGAVLTWHDDNLRTGWQQQETILTTSTLGSLGISHSVGLADQVDAQPLVIPGFINGHDIVFVADESNNVYQIDATHQKAILKQVNLWGPGPGCRLIAQLMDPTWELIPLPSSIGRLKRYLLSPT